MLEKTNRVRVVGEFVRLKFKNHVGILIDHCLRDYKLRNPAERINLIFHIKLLLLKLNDL